MKLNSLLDINPLLKLDEIMKIASLDSANIKSIDNIEFKKIKSNYLDKYTIWTGINGEEYIFVVKDNDKNIALMSTLRVTDLKLKTKKTPLMVKRTWCEKEYRNKGIISNLYRYIYNDLKFSLISDVEASPETVKIWNKLQAEWYTQMINIDTSEILEIDIDKLYEKPNKFALIVEAINGYDFNTGILNDYQFNMSGL